jgi:hypothetical protein
VRTTVQIATASQHEGPDGGGLGPEDGVGFGPQPVVQEIDVEPAGGHGSQQHADQGGQGHVSGHGQLELLVDEELAAQDAFYQASAVRGA